MAGQTVTVSVLADTRGFTRGMDRAAREATPAVDRLRGLARGASAALAGIGVGAGIGVVAGVGSAIRAASDLEQSIGGLESVFRDQSGAMHRFATDAAQAVGLSRDAYNGLATSIGTTLKNAGTPMSELAGSTNDLVTRAADLAATFGGPVTQSSNAMASALRGEFEPLRQYGISLNAAAIEARALADSGKSNARELTAQERALATQALIFEQSTDAAGAFARESGTLAGQTERLRASVANLAARAGGVLLPALTSLVTKANAALPALAGVGATLDRWKVPIAVVAGIIAAVFLPHLIALGVTATVTAAKQAAAWTVTQAGAIRAAAAHSLTVTRMVAGWVLMAAQSLAQAARMAAAWLIALGPVGIVIAVVVALVALIIANWSKISETTKRVWSALTGWLAGVWQSVKTTATNVWNSVVDFFRAVPGRLVDIFMRFTLPGLLIRHWDSIKSGAVAAWNGLVSWVAGIPGRLLTALGNVGALLRGVGGKIISGLLDGIRDKFADVRATLSRLTSLLPDWKGPAWRDRRLLRGAGRNVVGGFVDSLRERFPTVRRTLGELTDIVAGTSMPALAGGMLGAPTPAVAGGRLSGPRLYTVNVQALTPTPDVGRVVVEAIRDFERVNGADR